MNRRKLFEKGGAAAVGMLLGSSFAGRANTTVLSAAEPYFGRFGNELLTDDTGFSKLSVGDLRDQFFVFQLVPAENDRFFVRTPQDIEPELETSGDFPDVVLDTRLLNFHLGSDEEISSDTRATVRITFGSDQNTERSRAMGENLYWAITSGLQLWNTRGKKVQPRAYESDFRQVFGNKYVELPGGAGTLKVEIVKHRGTSWWEKVFNFANSNAGIGLISALGFPGVTSRVLNFVDEAANSFVGDNAKVMFSSRGLPLTFSKQARDEISSTGTRIGSLQSGIWIFARGRDLPLLGSHEMIYDATLRRLFPVQSKIADIVSGKADDPLKDVTYAVLSSRLKTRKITVGF